MKNEVPSYFIKLKVRGQGKSGLSGSFCNDLFYFSVEAFIMRTVMYVFMVLENFSCNHPQKPFQS